MITDEKLRLACEAFSRMQGRQSLPESQTYAQFQVAMRAALEAALGDKVRDAERLDWLVSAGTLNIAHWYRSGMAPFVELVDQDEAQIAEGRTLREAIDAAIAAHSDTGEGREGS